MPVHFNLAQLISIGAGWVVPLAVALLAKLRAPRNVKAVLNVLLTGLAGALVTVTVGADTSVSAYLTNIALAWFTSISSYFGFHKPSGLAGIIAIKTPRVGFGREVPEGSSPQNTSIPPIPSSANQAAA